MTETLPIAGGTLRGRVLGLEIFKYIHAFCRQFSKICPIMFDDSEWTNMGRPMNILYFPYSGAFAALTINNTEMMNYLTN